MTLSFSLSSEAERRLRERAAARGLPPDEYVAELVESSLNSPRSWREAMAPVQDAFRDSGMSDSETDRLLEQARLDAWEERQGKKAT